MDTTTKQTPSLILADASSADEATRQKAIAIIEAEAMQSWIDLIRLRREVVALRNAVAEFRAWTASNPIR